jgi:dienelactone hydrolase
MHGCGGIFDRAGNIHKRDIDWAERFTATGIAVLFPDSFNPRGVRQVCTLKEADRPVYPFGRSFDANGAADWLAAQPFIDKNRLGLIGWSHGGSTTLWSVRAGGVPKTVEFKAAIAFYPGCRILLERSKWQPRLPLKILMGTLDDWTPPQPCRDLAARHRIPMIEYPGAYHGFDAPNSPERILKGLTFTANGNGEAHIGTNPAARDASITEVMSTFKAAFGIGK